MATEGWIKISRGIERHWLWDDGNRLKWWIYLLLHAQWDNDKVLCGNQLIQLKRGQLLDSVNNLSAVWGCCRKTATQFLDTLQKENMISISKGYNSKSIITICNYETYQCSDMGIGSNTINNIDYNTGYTTGSKTAKEKEKNQKNKEKSKEVKKNSALSSSKEEYKPLAAADLSEKGKDVWNSYYQWRTGISYYWTKKDSKCMKELLAKVTAQITEANQTEEYILKCLKLLLQNIDDSWTCERLSVSIVNMKFNELMQQMVSKKKKATKKDGEGHVDFRPANI